MENPPDQLFVNNYWRLVVFSIDPTYITNPSDNQEFTRKLFAQYAQSNMLDCNAAYTTGCFLLPTQVTSQPITYIDFTSYMVEADSADQSAFVCILFKRHPVT